MTDKPENANKPKRTVVFAWALLVINTFLILITLSIGTQSSGYEYGAPSTGLVSFAIGILLLFLGGFSQIVIGFLGLVLPTPADH